MKKAILLLVFVLVNLFGISTSTWFQSKGLPIKIKEEQSHSSSSSSSVESANELSYNFTVPYEGAGMLIINNYGSSSVSITTLRFVINAAITGSPWGALFPYEASISSSTSGILTTYTVNMGTTNGVTIPASSSSSMTYSYTTSSGPLGGLGMGPSSVQVSLSSSNTSLISVSIAGKCQGSDCNDPTPGRQSSGYYPSWGMYARGYNAIDIPVRYINQIYYAFIGFHSDGTLYLLDSNSDPKQIPVISMLRQKYPYLKASLSFGGWTLSGPFSQMANSTSSLQNFVSNVIAALQESQFDGVDIDWEYPIVNGAPGEPTYLTPQDAEGYPLLLSSLRQALNDLGDKNKKDGNGLATEYLLSIAGPGGVDKLATLQKYNPNAWPTVIQSVDVVNVMAYDFHGAFDQSQKPPYDVTDFMSAMETSPLSPFDQSPILSQYNVEDPVSMYQQLGFKPSQISIGLPAYGRLVQVATIGDTYGLYQSITGTPPGQYDSTGVFDYRCIQERQCHGYTQLPSDIVFINPNTNSLGNDSHTPWGYSTSTLTFLTYDNAQSASYKCCWSLNNDFRGFMVWDLSGDFEPSDSNSIVGACYNAVNGNGNC